jgi:hypothetical protein
MNANFDISGFLSSTTLNDGFISCDGSATFGGGVLFNNGSYPHEIYNFQSNLKFSSEGDFQFVKSSATSSPILKLNSNGCEFNVDLEIKGDLDISGTVVVEELYKVKTFPLITQIHSFIQPNVNDQFTPPFFLSHVPSYDSNRINVVPFIKCVTNIMPYAMVIGTDADPENETVFVFEVRATSATDETDYSALTYSSTTYRGTITFSNIQEKTSEKVTVTSPSPILDGQLWGLYLVSATGHSGSTYGGELVMKLFFYQGEYSV